LRENKCFFIEVFFASRLATRFVEKNVLGQRKAKTTFLSELEIANLNQGSKFELEFKIAILIRFALFEPGQTFEPGSKLELGFKIRTILQNPKGIAKSRKSRKSRFDLFN